MHKNCKDDERGRVFSFLFLFVCLDVRCKQVSER